MVVLQLKPIAQRRDFWHNKNLRPLEGFSSTTTTIKTTTAATSSTPFSR
jgi:hypothetical protein